MPHVSLKAPSKSNGPPVSLKRAPALGRGADILRALQPPSEGGDIIILGSYAQSTGACVHRWGWGGNVVHTNTKNNS